MCHGSRAIGLLRRFGRSRVLAHAEKLEVSGSSPPRMENLARGAFAVGFHSQHGGRRRHSVAKADSILVGTRTTGSWVGALWRKLIRSWDGLRGRIDA